jgi:hypothetical protein
MKLLNVKACAITCAILWGAGMLLLTWWLMIFGQANAETAALIGQVYLGYNISLVGSFIGLFWGALDGLFGGFFFAWVYNYIAKRVHDFEEVVTN